MNLREHVAEIKKKYQAGQNLFRRQSVGFLLERISQLEAAHTLAHGQGEEYCVCEKPIAEKGFCFVCQSPVRPASKA